MTHTNTEGLSDAALVDQLRRLVDDQEGGDAVVLVQRQLFNRVVGRLDRLSRRAANSAGRVEVKERALSAYIKLLNKSDNRPSEEAVVDAILSSLAVEAEPVGISIDRFGEKLRAAMTERKTTLRDLAALIGVDKASASRACQGKSVSMEHFVLLWNWLHAISPVAEAEPVAWQRRLMNPVDDVNGHKAGTWGAWKECSAEQAAYAIETGGVKGFSPLLKAEARPVFATHPSSPVSAEVTVTDEMVERGLVCYSEGGCSGLSQLERREVVADIIEAALAALNGGRENG